MSEVLEEIPRGAIAAISNEKAEERLREVILEDLQKVIGGNAANFSLDERTNQLVLTIIDKKDPVRGGVEITTRGIELLVMATHEVRKTIMRMYPQHREIETQS